MIESILKDMAEGALKRQGTVRAVDIEAQINLGSGGYWATLRLPRVWNNMKIILDSVLKARVSQSKQFSII